MNPYRDAEKEEILKFFDNPNILGYCIYHAGLTIIDAHVTYHILQLH